MCGVAMLVPSKTRNGEPANSGSVEESTCAPGAEMSGFSRWAKSVGPADEKLVMMPERPVWISATSRPIVIFACPLVEAVAATSRCPSRSEIISIGKPGAIGIPFGSPDRLSLTIIPIAPAVAARYAFEKKLQVPRWTSAIFPFSEPAGSEALSSSGSDAGPQR